MSIEITTAMQKQADRDLSNRSINGVISYLFAFGYIFFVAKVSGYGTEKIYLVSSLIFLVTSLRIWLNNSFERIYSYKKNLWRYLFGLSLIFMAVLWSGVSTSLFIEMGLNIHGVMLIMPAIMLCAGGAFSLASGLFYSYLLFNILLLPYVVVLLSFSSTDSYIIAGVIIIFDMFIHYAAKLNSQSYWQALVNNELLAKRLDIEHELREEKEKFLAMMTHELKTPLAVVRMVLGSKTITSSLVKRAEQSIQDMDNLLERCNQVDRLEFNQKILSECLVNDLILAAIGKIESNVSLKPNIDENVIVRTDVRLLEIIVKNLLDNAVKYSAKEQLIEISLKKAGHRNEDGIVLEVANQPGHAGWPDPEKVFQKYYREPQAHQYTGSGLGLYLAALLADQLGGKLSYQPTKERVVFTLWLPLYSS